MLKIYNTLDEVPEADRQHYVKSDGKYVPQLSDDHPVLVHNKQLLSEKATATAKVKELEADIAAASEKSIPRGHKAVPNADVEELGKFKLLGSADEVTTKLTEHKTLSEKVAKTERDNSLRQLAKEHGYNEDAFIRLPSLPEFERREKDGKPDWIAKLKDGKGVITEKPAREFIESSTDIAPFMASLKQKQPAVQVHGSTLSTAPANDPHAWAKDYAKNYVEQSKPVADPFKAFTERSSI